MITAGKMHIAVIGSGAAGLSAAWLLSSKHRVTLIEKDDRLGGHAHTATVPGPTSICVDTGFIVYNEPCYPNLTNWFKVLGVETEKSDMSFAVSKENGTFEYAGGPPLGLLAQPSLTLRPRFWKMVIDLMRFYREAPEKIPTDSNMTLGQFLNAGGYSEAFIKDHLLPFGSAVWSTSKSNMLDYPAAAFIRFCDNHGLLKISNRPQWRTVSNGSHSYVNAVARAIGEQNIRTDFRVERVERRADDVLIHDRAGQVLRADHVVIAAHADHALELLEDADSLETELLSPFQYNPNAFPAKTQTRLVQLELR